MGESNVTWGEVASQDPTLGDVWDQYDPLPEAGSNPYLDAFIERKHLSTAALVRVGARLAEPTVIAFGGPGYLKYRDMTTGKRWNYPGISFGDLRVVAASATPSDLVILAEGETDAARLSMVYGVDVAVAAAGALYATSEQAAQLDAYERVLVALDTDDAGEKGAAKWLELLPKAERFAPPANDWCSLEGDFPPIPAPPEPVSILVSAGALVVLEPPTIESWFENALLPVGGQLILHGWAKSMKSFLASDMLAALAQGIPWCGFEALEEACKVVMMQYEIPWPYYRKRVISLREQAVNLELFDRNFLTVTPTQRPRFTAGNVADEDRMLKELQSAGVQVFCLDPVRRATGYADLNSEKEVRPLLAFFERLQREGITVVTCHHDNKTYARQGGGDPLGMTGAGSFSGDADSIVSVSVPKGATLEDPSRNLHFTFRNAPSIPPRGMRMGADGAIAYQLGAHGFETDASPTEGSTEPPI